MKKFIINLLLFIIPVIILIYPLDYFISKNLKKSNSFGVGEYSTWNDILDGKINSDIVINGSSRAYEHINPVMITEQLDIPAYNIGMSGHNFWLQYLRHSLLLENNAKPKLIIHSVDIFTLEKKKNLSNYVQFLPYMLWNDKIKDATISYNGFELIDYTVPLIRYNKSRDSKKVALSMAKIKTDKVGRIKGYEPRDRQWNSDFDEAKKR